ncbi:MAG TPA: cupin-like domain-containing protein, partial [Polyangiales bacterium]
DQVSAAALAKSGGFAPRSTPLLVRGALADWPVMSRWTFESLADLKRRDGTPAATTFQNGLIEQGETRAPLVLPVGPYLRALGEEHARVDHARLEEIGLLPNRVRKTLAAGERFHLDWSWLTTFETTQSYLAQWHLLDEFPALRDDITIRTLWPGQRYTWEFAFLGPANTVTGIHHDFPDNWFCQVRGVKEYMLFAPDQTEYVGESRKYDRGATLSDTDITRLHAQPERAARFAQAQGLYARVEPGDALFVPSTTWHAVVALTPAISLAVFGLTALQVLARGVPSEVKHFLHTLHLYRWGNCTCHGEGKGRYSAE